jgi:hypothetical protein
MMCVDPRKVLFRGPLLLCFCFDKRFSCLHFAQDILRDYIVLFTVSDCSLFIFVLSRLLVVTVNDALLGLARHG